MALLKGSPLTFKKVGELLNLSTTAVIDTFYNNLVEHKSLLPEILCIDEVYLGRKASKKYVAVLLNFKTNQIIGIIYGRYKDSLHSYFQNFSTDALDNVKYVSYDIYVKDIIS